MYLKDKAFKYLKNQTLFFSNSATFHIYLEMGKDNGDDYNDGESSDENCYE